jgi:replication-associated recombination protein RarA
LRCSQGYQRKLDAALGRSGVNKSSLAQMLAKDLSAADEKAFSSFNKEVSDVISQTGEPYDAKRRFALLEKAALLLIDEMLNSEAKAQAEMNDVFANIEVGF